MGCISCGNTERPMFDLPSHVGQLKACGQCISRFGAENIATEADRLLTEWFMTLSPPPVCPVCGDPLMVYSDGSHPAWCQECEGKRKAYVNAQR